MKQVKMGMGRRGVSFMVGGREGSELHGGWEGVEIAWAFVCR